MDPRVAARSRRLNQSQTPTPSRTSAGGSTNGTPPVRTFSSGHDERRTSEDSNSSGGNGRRTTSVPSDSNGVEPRPYVDTRTTTATVAVDSYTDDMDDADDANSASMLDETIKLSETALGAALFKKQSDLAQVFPPPNGAFQAATGHADSIQVAELQLRLRRYFAPILVRDDAAAACFQCSNKFGVLRRRVRMVESRGC